MSGFLSFPLSPKGCPPRTPSSTCNLTISKYGEQLTHQQKQHQVPRTKETTQPQQATQSSPNNRSHTTQNGSLCSAAKIFRYFFPKYLYFFILPLYFFEKVCYNIIICNSILLKIYIFFQKRCYSSDFVNKWGVLIGFSRSQACKSQRRQKRTHLYFGKRFLGL